MLFDLVFDECVGTLYIHSYLIRNGEEIESKIIIFGVFEGND